MSAHNSRNPLDGTFELNPRSKTQRMLGFIFCQWLAQFEEIAMSVHKLIFIHGMGEGDSSDEYQQLYDLIMKFYSQNNANGSQNFDLVPVEWQTVTFEAEKQIFKHAFPNLEPSPNIFQPIKSLRYFMTFFIGDIIAYTAEPENKNGIRKSVWQQIEAHCESAPYSILAHSLGSLIAFDYLYKLFEKNTMLYPGKKCETDEYKLNCFKDNFRNLFTFGSPIGLFMLRQGKLWLGDKPFTTIKNPVSQGHKWLNFYDNQDVAAYPLETLFMSNPENASASLEDIIVQTGNMVLNSHTHYWRNKKLAQRIASVL